MHKNPRKINVLHLFEMAAGPTIQTYFYRKFNYGNSWVISKVREHTVIDYYGIVEKYPRVRDVILEGLKRCNSNVDIVVIHGSEFAVPIFKILTRKKIVLQYHGSDINLDSRSRNPFRILFRSMADAIIYNQKSHLKKIITIRKVRKEFHPNAVDTDLFRPTGISRSGTLALLSNNLDRKKTLELLNKFKNVTILDRNNEVIPYNKMPNFLNKFELFIDHKVTDFGMVLEALSRTALEALACGCKVFHDGRYINELPDEHKPENVIKKLYTLFLEILDKNKKD